MLTTNIVYLDQRLGYIEVLETVNWVYLKVSQKFNFVKCTPSLTTIISIIVHWCKQEQWWIECIVTMAIT